MRRLDARQTSAWVRNPAGRPWKDRSIPIAPPATSAATRWSRMSRRASAMTRCTGTRETSSASVCMNALIMGPPWARGNAASGARACRMVAYDALVPRAPALLAIALLAAAFPADARRRDAPRPRPTRTTLALEGERVEVRWTDGDTFKILSGRHAGARARLQGVNALETFGPVHRWGALAPAFLLEVAKQSAAVAATSAGPCELAPRGDRYGRLLVSCPDVAATLVRAGHAMVFAVNGEPDAALVLLQREAQRSGVGIWSGGAPPRVPTSVHSGDEPDLGAEGAYDRIADTRTGRTEVVRHARSYRTCEEVCVGEGADRACMVYVPYALHYRNRPACLR